MMDRMPAPSRRGGATDPKATVGCRTQMTAVISKADLSIALSKGRGRSQGEVPLQAAINLHSRTVRATQGRYAKAGFSNQTRLRLATSNSTSTAIGTDKRPQSRARRRRLRLRRLRPRRDGFQPCQTIYPMSEALVGYARIVCLRSVAFRSWRIAIANRFMVSSACGPTRCAPRMWSLSSSTRTL